MSRPAHAVDTWLVRELSALERRYNNRCTDLKIESLFNDILKHYVHVATEVVVTRGERGKGDASPSSSKTS